MKEFEASQRPGQKPGGTGGRPRVGRLPVRRDRPVQRVVRDLRSAAGDCEMSLRENLVAVVLATCERNDGLCMDNDRERRKLVERVVGDLLIHFVVSKPRRKTRSGGGR